MRDVHVLITMDVEPLKLDANWTGPEDAASSERFIQAYWDVAGRAGYPVSFFIHPEIAQHHRKLFRRLEAAGACLGLHVHATKFQHPLWEYEYGYYSADEQRQMLADAKEQWAMALGRMPEYFRPGAFSANDYAFQTLVSMGFRGGSLSVPGRIWSERYCVWAGAEPDPHRAHASFRQVRGDLKFANIPLSVDFTQPMHGRGITWFQDLRPTARGVSTEQTLRNIVARLAKDEPDVPVVHVVAHNDQPFDDLNDESARRLEWVVKNVAAVCEEQGLRAVPSTVARVADRVLSLPPKAPRQWVGRNDVEC